MYYLLSESALLPARDVKIESVKINTLDDFCLTNRVDHISYLKIDTEGGDLAVLEGAVLMLTKFRIDLIQVKVGMNPFNRRHVSFESIKEFLESHRYYLFGIYGQVKERPNSEPHLRRTNPIFISKQMIETHKISAKPSV